MKSKYKLVGCLSVVYILILFFITPLAPFILAFILNRFRKSLIEDFNFLEVNFLLNILIGSILISVIDEYLLRFINPMELRSPFLTMSYLLTVLDTILGFALMAAGIKIRTHLKSINTLLNISLGFITMEV